MKGCIKLPGDTNMMRAAVKSNILGCLNSRLYSLLLHYPLLMSDHDLNLATTTSIEQLLDLLDRKIANPTNDDLQEQFFNDVLGYLLTTSSEHWWCDDRERLIAQESLWLFSLPDHPSISHYKEKLSKQLRSCRRCLVYYYGTKPVLRKR